MELLRCENVSLAYENQLAVKNVTFSVEEGDYICVVGENGSGKSTLIKGILGLLKPAEGQIWRAEALRNGSIGYLPQQTAAQKDFPATVFEVVLSGCLRARGARPFYSQRERRLAMDNMEKLQITPLKNRCYRDLSGGQQQRVLLARALCATDKLLILDEPVTGLDPLATAELYQVIRELNEKYQVAILMVSHDIRSILGQCKKVLQMKREVLFFGTTQEYEGSEAGKRFLGGGR